MASLSWYVNRLRRMSVPEMFWRSNKLVQNRLWRVSGAGDIAASAIPTGSAGDIAALQPPDVGRFGEDPACCIAAADQVLDGRFSVFGVPVPLQDGIPMWNQDPSSGINAPSQFGPTLDYRDPGLVGDIKFLWEPNRHLQVVTLAQAARLTGEQRYVDGLSRFLGSWLEQCRYLRGPNWTSSLELAIRLINWSLAWRILDCGDRDPFADGGPGTLRSRMLKSIYQHCYFIQRHYSRFSSANNHLIGEAAGVFVAACTWPQLPGIGAWGDKALEILTRELERQTTDDGLNAELTTAYHEFVMEFALAGLLAAKASAKVVPDSYRRTVSQMVGCMDVLADSEGNVPMFGDADDGHAFRLSYEQGFDSWRSLRQVGDAMTGSGDIECDEVEGQTLWLLDNTSVNVTPVDTNNLTTKPQADALMADAGYYLFGHQLGTAEEIRLWVDAGALGFLEIAAHGHADALAIYLSACGEEILVDPGTYAYHTRRVWRDYFKGTKAHNTVRIDGCDQSVSGGNFMWTRHANATTELCETDAGRAHMVASHDGYMRLDDPVLHRREIVFDKRTQVIDVTDTIECAAAHVIETNWHFAEHIAVELKPDGNSWSARGRNVAVEFTLPESPEVAAIESIRGRREPPFGWVSRSFAKKTASSSVCCEFRIEGTTTITTRLRIGVP